MREICLITTCMGRLAHLQQSLAAAVAQPHCSCVVVDYSCPERCGDWVEQHYPAVKVVRVPSPGGLFNISRARNCGVAVADSPWLCFVDADVILNPQFSECVLPLLHPKSFYLASPSVNELTGTVLHTPEVGVASDIVQQVQGVQTVLNHLLVEGVDRTPVSVSGPSTPRAARG